METTIYHKENLNDAAKILENGGVVAFPTETVYGLGAVATNEEAVKKVYEAKGRPSDNPLIVHVSSKEMLLPFISDLPEKGAKLIEAYWPGPLTIIFNIDNNSGLAPSVTAGLQTVAFRMPNHQVTLDLIDEVGLPLVGPSANTSGKPSPTLSKHVLHDLDGKINGILEGGSSHVGIESTVIDLSDYSNPVILRPGALTKLDIEKIIGTVELDQHLENQTLTPKSPGMKYKHYSPDAKVVIVEGDSSTWNEAVEFYHQQAQLVTLLASDILLSEINLENVYKTYSLSKNTDVTQAMTHLFSGLRELDSALVNREGIILVQGYPNYDNALGYMNRLFKASSQTIFGKTPN